MPGYGREVVTAAHVRANDLPSEETRLTAYRLRLQGLALREIPNHLPDNPGTGRPYSHVQVDRWIKAIVEQNRAPLREQLREMEGQRLDVYMTTLHEKYERAAAAGREQDAQRWMALLLDVQQRRARLFGLDAPVVSVVDTNVTIVQQEDADLAAQVDAARKAAQAARLIVTEGE